MKNSQAKPSDFAFLDALSPKIVLKFQERLDIPYEDGVEKQISSKYFKEVWDALTKIVPNATLKRKFKSVKPERLTELVAKARQLDPTYEAPLFTNYFEIHCNANANTDDALKTLNTSRLFEVAYLENAPTIPPAVNALDDPRAILQGYLDAAPVGINARYAWTFPGGDGAMIQFIDLEQGWTLNHEDLVAAGITLLSGQNQAFPGHGTAVLGEICAVDNTIGNIGIAPNCKARVVSQWRTPTLYDTADAIISAISNLQFGDVLLLEAQTNHLGAFHPVEIETAVFDAIRLGSALGIIIVEAAGNGSVNLDNYNHPTLGAVLNRTSRNFKDSGAIIVGAASSNVPHQRLNFSNFGNRVDCYGWGERIDTTGDGWMGNLTNSYTPSFGGTSGASPIITGAALAIQGVMESSLGMRLSPKQMRLILGSVANGTLSANPAIDQIGVMPDLQHILDNVLGLTPDVYLRDFVLDNGDAHTGAASASPDIFIPNFSVADPQLAFGQGSGTENRDDLGSEILAGADNFIYMRMKNRGAIAATNVEGTVYWSEVATLVTPNLWHLVGSTTIPIVPEGDQLIVAPPIKWQTGTIPPPGHYCFVGIVNAQGDPAPNPADFLDWNRFVNFIRNNNNVTWRNFNVVNNAPAPKSPYQGFVGLPFLLVGAPDKSRLFDLEFLAKFPKNTKVIFEIPLKILRIFQQIVPNIEIVEKRETALVTIRHIGKHKFENLSLPAKLQAPCTLWVALPEAARQFDFDISVGQFYKALEVGRVTWRLKDLKKEKKALNLPAQSHN
jgi:serine protease